MSSTSASAADRAGGDCSASSPGGADSTCLLLALGGSAIASARCTSTTDSRRGVGRRTRDSARSGSAPRSSSRRPRRQARRRCARSATRSAPAPARHRAHRERPGRDDPLPARLQRQHQGDQAAARGRRRAAAADALARGHGGLLSASAASLPHGLVQSRHRPRPDARRDVAAARDGSIRPRAANILRSLETRRRRCRPHWRSCSRSPPVRGGSTSAGAFRPCASTTGSGSSEGRCGLQGEVCWGAWRIRSELPGLVVRGWRAGDRLAGRRKKIQDVFVDAKVPRSEREAWPLVVRGGRGRCGAGDPRGRRGRGGAALSELELQSGVTSVLIDEERLRSRVLELGRRDQRRLRGARPAARRCPERRRLLHGRSDACDHRAVRDRLHGHLELRRLARLLGGRAYPQGSRPEHRGPSRARRRGHHRLGPDAFLPRA